MVNNVMSHESFDLIHCEKNSGLMIMMRSENILLYIQELLFLGSEVNNCKRN